MTLLCVYLINLLRLWKRTEIIGKTSSMLDKRTNIRETPKVNPKE